ncbi:MAG: aminoglycoside phosphotransferase family protein, partial [bacterium]|nr:aminoglycoside phosphotransferase family protein [bacterium]
EQFKIGGTFISAVPHGSGHINDSFKVTFIESGNTFHYLFQRINHNVFFNPPRVMDNIELATHHIRRKLEANGTANIHRRVLTTIPTHEKRSFFKTPAGDYWRAYHFITGAATHDELQSPEQAFQVAKAFAGFQEMLRDLPTATLHETIPDFHNGPKRFETFQKVLKADSFNRAKEARKEIEFIEERAFVFDLLPGLVREGKIALRVTHNDTKVNNVLLDEKTGRGICVIDLDTVMPGVSLYDFGDLARSVLSDVPEDSQDLSAVAVNLPVFEALTKGFLGVSEGFLSPLERGL